MDGETGQFVWSETYSTLHNERLVAAALNQDGDLFVIGRAFGDGFYDIIVQRYQFTNGVNAWTRFIASSAILDDVGWDIDVDSQGRVVVCGMVGTSPSEANVVTAIYEPIMGEIVWQTELPGAVYNIESLAGWVQVTDGDDVIMGTRSWSTATGFDLVLRRYAASDGSEVWAQDWNSGGITADDPHGMVLDGNGDVIMAGVTAGDYLVAKFSGATGTPMWHSTYAGPPDWYDVATCVDVAAEGTIVASGYSDGNGTGWYVATVGFDGDDGTSLWAVRFDGYGLSDEARDVAIGDDGTIAVVGYCYSYDAGFDALTAYYEPSGATAAPVFESPLLASLDRAWPNPFNPRVTVSYALPRQGAVSLAVFDTRGRLITELVDAVQGAGRHSAEWDGCNRTGRAVASGVYLAVLRTDDGTSSRKLVLSK